MLETLMVPVYGLKEAEAAVTHAARLAIPLSARVLVFGIIEEISGMETNQFIDPVIWNITKSEARYKLNQHVRYLVEQGIDTSLEIVEVSSIEALLEYANEIHCDLIVIVDNDETQFPMIRSIFKHSKIPIFLTRRERIKPSYTNILIPLDGSQRAETSLAIALTVAKVTNAQLHLTHVVQQPEMLRQTALSVEDAKIAQRLVERNAEEAKRYLEQVASRLTSRVRIHVRTNGTVTTSLHNFVEQEGIDLLVLSAHGYTGEPQWPFGAVAENLVSYCKVPTIIVQDLPAAFSSPQLEPIRVQNNGY
jgi:nucleotide-binding universal stress UspA family protein